MSLDIRGLAPLLQVFDMPTSIAFYTGVLGFEVAATSHPGPHFDWALLKLNNIELMLNTAHESDARPPAPAPDPARIAAHDDICLYFGCPDVDAAYTFLRAKGLNVKPPMVQAYGMKQLYVRDPDGYLVCLQWEASKNVE